MSRSKNPIFIQLLNMGAWPEDPQEEIPLDGSTLPDKMQKVLKRPLKNGKPLKNCSTALTDSVMGGGIIGDCRSVEDGPWVWTVKVEYRKKWNRRLKSLKLFVDAWVNHRHKTKASKEIIAEGVMLAKECHEMRSATIPKGERGVCPADLELESGFLHASFGAENPDGYFSAAWYEIFRSIEVAQIRAETVRKRKRVKWAPRNCQECGDYYAVDYWLEKGRLEGAQPSCYCSDKCAKLAERKRRKKRLDG